MKHIKLGFVASSAVVLLASCKSLHTVAVPVGVDNSVTFTKIKSNVSDEEQKRWSHANLATDSLPGMSVDKAYELLQNRKSTSVIVAVADSGTDIQHEDLKGKLWINTKEVVGNGKDDDKNGFVDDINGWNFIGDTYDESLELTRQYAKLKPKFEGKTLADFKDADTTAFQKFKDLEEDYTSNFERVNKQKQQYTFYYDMFKNTHESMQELTGKKDYQLEDVKKIETAFEFRQKQKELAVQVLSNGIRIEDQLAELKPAVDHYTSQAKYYYNTEFNGREKLGDNGYDFSVKVYGNNNVDDQGHDEIHGTHVSGIIMAERNNKLGVRGVAENVLLMPVRVVPNGDEYDKDVALGIRYAVDNGAKVINTSFGKGYSPNAEWVYEAIQYAAKKDVLIVNAAGNDAQDIDVKPTFPNDAPDLKTEIADNVLTVGASTVQYNENLPATFSNFGKINVDVFAPGHEIYATVPNNKYQNLSGTSMASPGAAGVAALIRSYFPKLSASQVKHILMNSGTKINFEVNKPGTQDKVPFADLCVSGRIVNAYNAVQMALEMTGKKK